MDFTERDAQQLGQKLAGLELAAGERAALDTVFDAASTDEVAGYMIRPADRYANVALLARGYIGETEKNRPVFEPNNHPGRYS